MRICIAELKIDIDCLFDWWLDWLIGQMIDRSVANPILMHFGQHEQHLQLLQSAGSAATVAVAAATVTRVQQ